MSIAGRPVTNASGEFKRQVSQFRNFISKESGSKFKPEANRYHLYVSLACPWAHRALITRKLQKLDSLIDVSIVHYHMDENGWRFINKAEFEQYPDMKYGTSEPLYGFERIKQLYYKADENYNARFTVPLLWDKKNETVVSNESSEIIRMLGEFNDLTGYTLDLYPESLRSKIDEINDWVYPYINNGVYKTGFTTNQEVYEKEVTQLFTHLDKAEQLLSDKYVNNADAEFYYLVGDQLTEADVRLFTTIIRFDPVYHQHFKCNMRMIRHDYPYLHKWLQKLYWNDSAFKSTTDFDHIKKHYTQSHPNINPYGIVPLGPVPHILPL